jgi:hypothetical protein
MSRRSPTTGSNETPDPVVPREDSPTPRRSWLVYAIAAAGLTVVAGVAAVGFALAPGSVSDRDPGSGSGSGSGSETPAVVATPTPVAGGEEPVDETVADDLLTDFVVTAAALVADPEAGIDSISTVAAGAIVAELESERLELEVNEFSKVGTPKVESVEVLEQTETTATVQACIDSSDVKVVDADGNEVNSPGGTSPRALNIFSLELRDGSWIVVARTFPNDPQC